MTFFNKVTSFCKESHDELINKVSWPSRSELANSAVIVLTASLIIALIVFGIDQVFEHFMSFIYNTVL